MSRKPIVGRPLSIIMSAEDNIARYLKQPSIKKVESVMNYMGVNKQVFENLFGLPEGILRQYTGGFRKKIPAKYWHLFFEMKQIKKMVRKQVMSQPYESNLGLNVSPKQEKQVSQTALKILDEYRNRTNSRAAV